MPTELPVIAGKLILVYLFLFYYYVDFIRYFKSSKDSNIPSTYRDIAFLFY